MPPRPANRRDDANNATSEDPQPSLSSSSEETPVAAQTASGPTSVDASTLFVQTLASMQTMFERSMQQQREANEAQREANQAQAAMMARMLESLERRANQPPQHQQQPEHPTEFAVGGTQAPWTRQQQNQQRQQPMRPAPFESPAHNGRFDQSGMSFAVAEPVLRRPTVKPDDIGLFNGSPDRLEFFRSRVDALIQSRSDPGWEQAVIETLPLCLRDTAAQWYQLMGSSQRAELSAGWPAWETALQKAFSPDDGEARRLADNRKWVFQSETIQQYFYSKLSLLRSAYPLRDERELAQEIRLGLPDSMRVLVRSHFKAGMVPNDMLVELKSLEKLWRSATRNHLRTPVSATPTSASRSLVTALPEDAWSGPQVTQITPAKQTLLPRSSPRQQPHIAGGLSMASDYRPENISHIERDGRRIRAYKLPQSGRMIYLGRSCRQCGKAHFDFEHDHVSTQVKAEAHLQYAQAELELVKAYGYPMFNTDPIVCRDASCFTVPFCR